MITFSLTGGIASGKSTVTRTIKNLGIPMVDADQVAREVVVPGSYGLRRIIDTFGKSHLQEDGTLNRGSLAELVFSDETAMSQLNKIMAPLINEESIRQLWSLHINQGFKVIGYDAALIIEMGNADKFRPLIVVNCPREMQIERMIKRNSFSREGAEARLRNQIPNEDKVKLADYVIDTSGSIEESKRQTKNIIHSIRKTIGRYCWDCGRQYCQGDLAIMCEGCGYDNPFKA